MAVTETSPFTSIPTLPLAAARSPTSKPAFLAQLRAALLGVGFLYLDVSGEPALPPALLDAVVREGVDFFARLPLGEKEAIEMKNEKSFLGWSRVSQKDLFLSLLRARLSNISFLMSIFFFACGLLFKSIACFFRSITIQISLNKCRQAHLPPTLLACMR